MLNVDLKKGEEVLFEEFNVLINMNGDKKLYDVIVTNKRILIYLNDFEYDLTPFPTFYRGAQIVFKDHFREILISDIINKEENVFYLENEKIEIFNEEIINYIKC